MNRIIINGEKPLYGAINVQGAKNGSLPILAATLLCGGQSVIHNCPRIRDVDIAVKILEYLGCGVKREGSTIVVDASSFDRCDIPDHLMGEMRSSVIFLGAILSRKGMAVMSHPGGCELGPRPIDLHLSAIRDLGALVLEEGGIVHCSGGEKGLAGVDINLSFPSVGATENIMLAAVGAKGVTRIINAAREPEIEDLQLFLQELGVRIKGAGSSIIEIEGGPCASACEHTVLPDRIAAATWLCAAAMAGGHVLLENACPAHLLPVTAILGNAGCKIRATGDKIEIEKDGRLKGFKPIRTMPYPGFPTDAQAIMMAVASVCDGTTLFVETMFDNRYRHVDEMARMGADIRVAGRCAVVYGVPKLSGARVEASDLRGGASLVVAGLGAAGKTEITNIKHIERGYEDISESLKAIGAEIQTLREP